MVRIHKVALNRICDLSTISINRKSVPVKKNSHWIDTMARVTVAGNDGGCRVDKG